MRIFYLYILSVALASVLFCREVSVLSYNVHGLPSFIANDSPKTRVPLILSRSEGYDIILIQENWIFSKRQLESWLPGFDIVTAKRSRFLPVIRDILNPNGSGLAIAVRDGLEIISTGEISFDTCSGWKDQANDCLASKGVLHARIDTGTGEIDIYNTHLDAGGSVYDRRARERQASHMSSYMERTSEGRAIVLGGDLNIEISSDEFSVLSRLTKGLGLSNVNWRPRGSDMQYIDYIMLRGSGGLDIDVLGSGVDSTLDGLSDHPPIHARIKLN